MNDLFRTGPRPCQWAGPRIGMLELRHVEHGALWRKEHGTRVMDNGDLNMESEARNVESGAWKMENGACNMKNWLWSVEHEELTVEQ